MNHPHLDPKLFAHLEIAICRVSFTILISGSQLIKSQADVIIHITLSLVPWNEYSFNQIGLFLIRFGQIIIKVIVSSNVFPANFVGGYLFFSLSFKSRASRAIISIPTFRILSFSITYT